MSNGLRVILGATGAVGSTILEVLAEREFLAAEVVPLAPSARPASGPFAGSELRPRASDESIQGLDLVLSRRGGAWSAPSGRRGWSTPAPWSSTTRAWRMHHDVPLVVAEVNPDHLAEHCGLVANPNCTTMERIAVALIQREAGLERLIVSPTGAGFPGTGRRAIVPSCASRPRLSSPASSRSPRSFLRLIAFNVLPQVETFKDGATTTRPRSAR